MLVAKARKRVERQKEILAALSLNGHSTRLATDLLNEYERSLVLYEMRLSRILKG